MNSGREIRNEQADRRQAIGDRFIADAAANSDVQAAAREAAEAEVRRQQQADFEAQVRAIQETAKQATEN